MDNKFDIASMNEAELKDMVIQLGEPAYRAKQIFEWLHDRMCTKAEDMVNIPNTLRDKLNEHCYIPDPVIVDCLESVGDGTKKYLFAFQDGNTVESVFMRYHHGNSVCISSQIGCRMGCSFCASTIGGKLRDLGASEMLAQIYAITRNLNERISNIVIMGTGEPLDNYDNLVRFIYLASHEKGINISRRNITVSTCGLVPEIRKLADEELPITLAISLHAPNDELRKSIMPIANKYSVSEIMNVCDEYFDKTGRRISFEYSLINGVNDNEENARELASLLKGKNCHVNLIPINPIKERNYQRSGDSRVNLFKNILEKNRINVTIRREMGSDIQAACGQLRRGHIEGR